MLHRENLVALGKALANADKKAPGQAYIYRS